jgi:hypothetical protein
MELDVGRSFNGGQRLLLVTRVRLKAWKALVRSAVDEEAAGLLVTLDDPGSEISSK